MIKMAMTSSETPTTHRRPHTKSRYGCQHCKKNRVKCDEQKPICGRCQRVGQECSLANPDSGLIMINGQRNLAPTKSYASSSESVNNSDPSPLSSAESPVSRDGNTIHTSLSPQFTELEKQRLWLMNHYAVSASEDIASIILSDGRARKLWQVEIPRMAFHHDFLLHGILAVSALHLALTEPENSHKTAPLSIYHNDVGSALFRSQVENITADNVSALFAFSQLTTVFHFGIDRVTPSEKMLLPKLYEFFALIRGCRYVVETGRHWLETGMFQDALLGRETTLELEPLRDDIDKALALLTERINDSLTTTVQSDIYTAAIDLIRHSLLLATKRPHSQNVVIVFPLCAPAAFLEMMCLGEPLALSILATYSVILHWLSDFVFVGRWGKQTIEAIRETLPPNWQPCIEWALKEASII